MGNGNSKGETPTVAQRAMVNIMVTKEVTERWEALHLQKIQQVSAKDKDYDLSNQTGGSGDGVDNNPNSKKKTEVDETFTGGDHCHGNELGFKSTPSSTTSIDLSTLPKNNAPDAMQKTTPDSVDQSDEVVRTSDNMDKFANFFVPRNSLKLPNDLENGNDAFNPSLNSETRFSAFLQSTEDTDPAAVFEEIDETVEMKKSHNEFIDEEMGNNWNGASNYKSYDMAEIRVPVPALPVILDQDKEGKVTVETVNAWNIRQRFEKVLAKNNEHWAGELRRITAKVEDETRRRADNLQRRIDELKKEHADAIEAPFKVNGGQCNILVSQLGDCYQNNKNQVLKCSELVRKFAQCTNKTG